MSLDEPGRMASHLPTADAAAAAFRSPLFGKVVIVGGLLGILTCWNAFFIGATRLLYAMARAGFLPEAFAALHSRHKTPHVAICFVSICTVTALLLGRQAPVWLANSCSFALVVAYFLVALSLIGLRRREPALPRPSAVRHPRVVGAGALASSVIFVLLYLPGSPSALEWPQEWGVITAWAALGAPAYRCSHRARNAISAEEHERRIFGNYSRRSHEVDQARPRTGGSLKTKYKPYTEGERAE